MPDLATPLPYPKIAGWPCKYSYVARDGKDVAVSYDHLYWTHNGYTFAEFFDSFLMGEVIDFGSVGSMALSGG